MFRSIFYRSHSLLQVSTFSLICFFSLPGQTYQSKPLLPTDIHFSSVKNPSVSASQQTHCAEKKDHYKSDKKDWKNHYESMTPREREELKKRREYFKSLPPEERQRIHQAREKFRNLPAEKREALKERWRNMSPEEQRAFRKRIDQNGNFSEDDQD